VAQRKSEHRAFDVDTSVCVREEETGSLRNLQTKTTPFFIRLFLKSFTVSEMR
jgi:hypothetical protein